MRTGTRGAAGLLFCTLSLGSCAEEPAPSPWEPAQNLLLVTIDTLRADRLGCYGYELAETPNIDALAAGGVRFEEVQSVAPITMVAHTSLMTGTVPPHHGVRDNASHRALPELTTLAEVLRAEGFRTGAFVSAFVLDSIYGLDQGFEVYGDVPQRVPQPTSEFEERPGQEVNQEAVAWLRRLGPDERFFVWVHYFEPHQPHPRPAELPPHLRERPYDADVALADRVLGQLLGLLEESGHRDDTLIVLTSDHGESLGQHGEETHGFFAYQPVLRVPLVLAHEDLDAGRVVKDRVSLIDVLPTVLELLHVVPPPVPEPARSLLPLLRGEELPPRPTYFESWVPMLSYGWAPLQGVAEGDLKYIRAPRPELYELASDPGEETNLHSTRAEEARTLARSLEELLAENEDRARGERAKRELSGEERQRLAELGYTGTAAAAEPELTLRDPKDGIERIRKEQLARGLLDEGQLEPAAGLLNELLAEEPENPVFNAHLGLLRMLQSRHAEAIPHLEEAIQGGLDNATTRSNLGTSFLKVDRHADAVRELREALEQNPKHLVSWFWLGRTHLAAGQKPEARKCFEQILELWDGPEGAMTEQVRGYLRQLGGG